MKENYFVSGFKAMTHKSLFALMMAFSFANTAFSQVQIVYTSDSHYGIKRANFQSATSVDAHVVNAALVKTINGLPTISFPSDNGLYAGKTIGPIDYVINTGDIANRMETSSSVQSAAASWDQFKIDYLDGLTLTNSKGEKTPLLLLPGNHDATNAIGFYKTMSPLIDKTSMVNMYNMMINPATPKTVDTYDYKVDKVNYSRNIGGVHFMFVTLWPDSANRIWMANDLASVDKKMPVVIFVHDQPDIETKHLTNPNGTHDINSTDKFENMVEEFCKDGKTVKVSSNIEQQAFTDFVKANPNIKAYFHGNSNYNEYYTYTGPDNSIALRTIRVDSPMKGDISSTDETKTSYQVISLDTVSKVMTVRECLWNASATNGAPVQWGNTISFALSMADSLLSVASEKSEANYTTPSWTKLKMAMKAASLNKDDASANSLQAALDALKAKDMPYNVVMSFNGAPTTQMGFAWYTNSGVNGGKVEVVSGNSTDFSAPLFSVPATSVGLNNVNYNVSGNNLLVLADIADLSKRSYTSNKALVTGLTPNTTYSFRVGKDGAWSQTGTFTTAKDTKEPFSFIYTTDPQAKTTDMFDISQRTTHTAQKMYPNANFWLSCGDLIETSGSTNSEWEYEQFFETQQDIFLKNPTAYIIGNHDKSANKNFTNHFNTPTTPFDSIQTTPGAVYSFVYGDALFMAMSYEDQGVPGYLDELAKWMREQVAANPNVKWRIAYFHKNMYTGSKSHQSDSDGKNVRETMGPVFDELNIDLALQGHDHIYEVMGPVKAKALVPNAVQNQLTVTFDARENVTGRLNGTFNVMNGTLYFLNNSAGKKKYEPRSEADMQAAEGSIGMTNYFGLFNGRFGQRGLPTFSNISVSTDTITVKTYEVNDAGEAALFDSFNVVKTSSFVTGINNASAGVNAINFYPNPVKNYAYITMSDFLKARVEIYNMAGSLVKSNMIQGSAQIDLNDLTKGTYVLKVNAGKENNYVVKFIKQ